MTKIGSIEVDDSVCFELGGCDVQHGKCVPDVVEKLYSTAGLPCVLFDDAAAVAVEQTMGDETSDEQGTLTCIQPDGSMSDGQVHSGLVEHLEVAATTEPAIGNEDDEDPFDDLPFMAVQAALRSMCPCAYGIGDIVKIGHIMSAHDLQDALAMVVGTVSNGSVPTTSGSMCLFVEANFGYWRSTWKWLRKSLLQYTAILDGAK